MRLGHAHAERERDQDLSDFAESRYDYSISHVFLLYLLFTCLVRDTACITFACTGAAVLVPLEKRVQDAGMENFYTQIMTN